MKATDPIPHPHAAPIVVVAGDSMKGSLSSAEVADAAERGIMAAIPAALVRKVKVADGGEGTIDAIADSLGGKLVSATVADALGSDIDASYLWVQDKALAVIEVARVIGLPLLEPERRNPGITTSFGVGQLMLDALGRGASRIVLCLGGSSTNDGGMGILSALGVRFLDADGFPLPPVGDSLVKVAGIDVSELDPRLANCQIEGACDVSNPPAGPRGASHVYAPQKGADHKKVEELERGMLNYLEALSGFSAGNAAKCNRGGAAGGIGVGIASILGATLRSGVELVLEIIAFDRHLEGAQLVITGEGRIDSSTADGKAPSAVLAHASAKGIPTVAIAGSVEDSTTLCKSGFLAIFPIVEGPSSLEDCLRPEVAKRNVARTCAQIARTFFRTPD